MASAPSNPSGGSKEIGKFPYFVATLHHAHQINSKNPHGISTVNKLLDARAESDPELPVVGMGIPGDGDKAWESEVYTFADLSGISNILAYKLVKECDLLALDEEASRNVPPTAAILSHNSLEFLMTFFALLRIGYTVLLISPHCASPDISYLLETANATHLFHSPSCKHLADSSELGLCKPYELLEIPQLSKVKPYSTPSGIVGSTTAYIHHTSGTTGRPKPIPHTHAAATSCLPYLPPPSPQVAFTTSPLYHGGTADLMRSLMSSSMIWLYPHISVTSGNILKGLEAADDVGLPVKLFSAVPEVLKLYADSEELLRRMIQMEMVGFGGAPLESMLGSNLVKKGVKLVSRFGSSECGFLMSSYRDFPLDKGWEYLRVPFGCESLKFKQDFDTGKFELIVLPGWPQIATPNRSDGSYATGDLFTKHSNIEGAYKYEGRSDARIILSNGKKFDPTTIEEAFKEFDIINQAIVFGNGRAFPGALLFMKASRLAFGSIKELVKKVNEKAHWRIMEDMVIVICPGENPPISSKNTVMRGDAENRYRKEIDQAYGNFENNVFEENNEVEGKIETTDVNSVKRAMHYIVNDVTGTTWITGDTDLYRAGVDSNMATEIRSRLIRDLKISKPLSRNVVYEQRTIEGFARFITTGGEMNEDQQLNLMLHLVKKYGDFNVAENQTATGMTKEHVVVLTGATGALGAHILYQLCNNRDRIKKIFCLCRAKGHDKPQDRIQESLRTRKLPQRIPFHEKGKVNVMVLEVQLGDNHLGLDEGTYDQLKQEVTLVIHAAWDVNFLAPLESFEKDHISGVRNLINLTLGSSHYSRFFFCSSTAAVLGNAESYTTIAEKFTDDPRTAAPLGYGRSKWVAEKICQKIGRRTGVLRVGQLCGDTMHGVWNETEAWPLIFASANMTDCLPELNEKLSWLPVDIAAKVVLDIAMDDNLDDFPREPVFHVVNTDNSTSWGSVLSCIEELGVKFSRVPPDQWVKKLASTNDEPGNPSRKLLGHWESKYDKGENCTPDEANITFEVENTVALSKALGSKGGKVSKEYVQRIWQSWKQSGFVKM